MSEIIDELKALESALESSLKPAKAIKAISPINEFLDTTSRINDIFAKSAEIDFRLMKLHTDFQIEYSKRLAEMKKAPATEPSSLSNDIKH